ncbi:hypothetical protein [Leucobacter iarius]|uniref:Minor tail protein n=1 Tax=Leucobacter iarius TaxID=333963 RepID=A0ABP4XTQ5_9MICO
MTATATIENHRPRVYIDGKLVASGRSERTTAIADFSISWGANDWWTPVDPAELKLRLIDPFGELLDYTAATDRALPIQIRRKDVMAGSGESTVFVGQIETITAKYGTVTHPGTGKKREVWFIDIVARDPLGQLAADRRHGPKWPAREEQQKRLHWGPGKMVERRQYLSVRSPVPIDWQPTRLDQYDDAAMLLVYPVAAYETQQNVSVLTVLQNTARISEVQNRVYYDPRANLIRFIGPADNRSVDLYATGELRLSAGDGVMLEGTKFSPKNGITAASTAREQVTRVELTRRAETRQKSDTPTYMTMTETSEERNYVPSAPSAMTVQMTTDHSWGYDYWPAWDINLFATITGIYGRQNTGPLIWRPREDVETYPGGYAQQFLNPAPPLDANGRPVVYMLKNSLTNWAPGTGPFSIVGGELTYGPQGWRAQLNPAPVPVTGPSGPRTLGEVTSTRLIGQLAAGYTVADYSKITYVR